jgi:hypothetical protein
MTFASEFFASGYFPSRVDQAPFGEILNDLFFDPISDNSDFPLHGPNVIRFTEALLRDAPAGEPGLLQEDGAEAWGVYMKHYGEITEALEAEPGEKKATRAKTVDLLRIAALFHDIGKTIRRPNHPPIGANLLRNFNEDQRRRLVEALVHQSDPAGSDAKFNRFSLISSIVQHHDKFGVVSTGEAALPLFSDILYFSSDASTISGIRKNVTSVMVLNLADIAAVNTASRASQEKALELARAVGVRRRSSPQTPDKSETVQLQELTDICKSPDTCLGLNADKLTKVLEDWNALMRVIAHEDVRGNRVKVKQHLLELERSPARTIKRILRLLQESANTTNCNALTDGRFLSTASVESIVVGTLGAYQFQTFCGLLATVAKLDYGLNFFKAIMCACARKAIDPAYRCGSDPGAPGSWKGLSDVEAGKLADLTEESKVNLGSKVTTLFIRVLEGLLNRYLGVLGYSKTDPRRFGFQLRDLTSDQKTRDNIINLLCVDEHKDPIALTWISEEVTIWSMD